jgi:murein DD-endopeptidase MepM/ murein hydrolase activator NlpD
MDRRFHIIITSEQGRARTFAISKGILKKMAALMVVVSVIILVTGVTYSIEKFNLNKINTLENNVANLSTTNRTLQDQKDTQISGVYGELSRRNQVVESILSTLDISTPPPSSGKDSGGPFNSIASRPYDDLIAQVDQKLETLRPLPLGYPVKTSEISSSFGARLDPVNGETAFHDGVDLRGNYGAMVKATADGKVIEQGYNDDYGWYVLLNHGNKFTTLYAHNQKVLAKPGEMVLRGQTIALLGNTGRTTGPHLHYEIRRNNRPINPSKYLNIARLLVGNFG